MQPPLEKKRTRNVETRGSLRRPGGGIIFHRMVSATASAVTYLPIGVFLLPPLETRRAIYLVGGKKERERDRDGDRKRQKRET